MDYQDDADIYEHGIISAHPLAGLRLLATTRYPIYSGYSLAIVDVDDSSLTDRAIHVGQCRWLMRCGTSTKNQTCGTAFALRSIT